jgi:hypothetical protein
MVSIFSFSILDSRWIRGEEEGRERKRKGKEEKEKDKYLPSAHTVFLYVCGFL